MNSSSFLRKALPHIIAVVSFLVISIILYRPILFEGKVMDQNDINQGIGAGSEIREFREKKELLFRQVAALIEVDPSLVSKIERGDKRPTRE